MDQGFLLKPEMDLFSLCLKNVGVYASPAMLFPNFRARIIFFFYEDGQGSSSSNYYVKRFATSIFKLQVSQRFGFKIIHENRDSVVREKIFFEPRKEMELPFIRNENLFSFFYDKRHSNESSDISHFPLLLRSTKCKEFLFCSLRQSFI